ncbi:MAG: HEPN domain-containing protein [Deferribacterales bacterium]
MIDIEKLSKTGKFVIGDSSELVGELHLNAETTKLTLYTDECCTYQNVSEIIGTLHDGTKVTLIDCFNQSSGSIGILIDDVVPPKYENHDFLDTFPRYVIFGNRHIYATEKVIHEVSFIIDDAHNIFYDFDVYGSIHTSTPLIKDIIKKKSESIGRDIEVGENPWIFYYTGKYQIFSVDTELGVISATHNPKIKFPGVHGIKVIDSIKLNITFGMPKTISEAIENIYVLLNFIEIIAGRRQNVSDLILNLSNTQERPVQLTVYWCMPPKRDSINDFHIPHPTDIPIQAAIEPEIFGSVLSNWLKCDEDKRNARVRYINGISKGKKYDIDRLIGAANIFDILIKSKSPREKSLEAKIIERVGLIKEKVGDYFKDLDIVVKHAVKCRKYYVHGTKTEIDYSKNPDITVFFTDTLEFIFATSDLIEAGWNMTKWMREATSDGHPFAYFKLSYAYNLIELKKVLEN